MSAQELPKLHYDIVGATPTEHKDPMAMLMSFEIYSQIICAWAPFRRRYWISIAPWQITV